MASAFSIWLKNLVPVRTGAVEKEFRHDPGRICEYTMPAVGDPVRGMEDGRWFGEGRVTFIEEDYEDEYCEVYVNRPLLGALGQEPFTAVTRVSDIWLAKPDMPLLPVMWRLTDSFSQEWAATTEGRIAAADLGLRVIRSRSQGLLIGTDDLPPRWFDMLKRHLLPYFNAMYNAKDAAERSPKARCQNAG
ncbi:MAG: hypothetical protein HDQ87_05490 [Clostridia bacterium]|nr:hypothetical protein [Clostridia bacterium]